MIDQYHVIALKVKICTIEVLKSADMTKSKDTSQKCLLI